MSRIEIVPIKPVSDGDASHRAPAEWKVVNPPTIYLEKIATLWMEQRGETKPGLRYYLDKLPDGYTLFERGRPGNPKIVDKHLYGHPRGQKFFDSPNRFFPHFSYLMSNGNTQGCKCTLCEAKGSVPLRIGHSQAKKSQQLLKSTPQPINKTIAVDEEATPDTIRQCIDKLKKSGELDVPIEEKLSMDWRAERALLPDALSKLAKQKSWLPRVGELVLFIRDGSSEIFLEDDSKEYRLLQGEKATVPKWEAGVVGQIPDEGIKLDDIVVETTKTQGIAYSGYRVEPLPDPNSKDKSLSRRYKYVPLHHIRPFVFWKEFLHGVPHKNWNPTIKNALTVMGSISLLDKFRFKGSWPAATIFCHGMYIGSELITVGDTVRIVPRKDNVRDVLQVESFRLDLSNLDKASDDDEDEGHPYNTKVHVCGKAFTLDENRAWNPTPVSRAHPGMEGYDDWYWLHDPAKLYRLAFSRILGRCFEANPMLLWFPNSGDGEVCSSLNYGLSGVEEARAYSTKHDNRILPGKSWFWGDSRAETLDIKSFNNVDVSYYDGERDDEKLDEWLKAAKVLEKTASASEQAALAQKTNNHHLATTSAGAEAVSGSGGALRAAAGITVAVGTPKPETPEEEEESDASLKVLSVRRSESTINSIKSAPGDPKPSKKRSFSTMASSHDELDQDVGASASYSLSEWIKPVAMQPKINTTIRNTRSPAPKPTAAKPSHHTQPGSKSKAAPNKLHQATGLKAKPKQESVSASQQLHRETEAATSEEISSESQSPSDALAAFQNPSMLGAAALAAFKRPKVVISIDD